ncbi:hypothetical protein [Halorussus marinus]|uniref:hypothetical protein n=1 Tax=Halorussus marinus TaxID=2505976 RepID=UPI00106EFAA2|nr:hypothetical protein [Halorussus marinus]
MSETARLRVSKHVRGERWAQRSADPVMNPVDAWADATEIFGHGLDGDEVRYHEHSETVLVRKDDTLVTVIDATTAKRSVRHAIHHFGGGSA